ncbi:craniofacial development protein 2-like [Parasteatoda tepidariorum]|uniref:craniofacial development protein 2-like n=1 Tax=Parasteatoda tepidariorum TaxID=114398 RepID=UPI0039BD67D0
MPAGASAPGRVTQVGLVGGETPDKEDHPGPPTNIPEQTSWRRTRKGFKELRVGSWNIRSLYRNKGLQMLIDQVENYQIDVMAIQEVRWTGDGIIEKKNHTVIYSCDKKKHIFGTGFILSKRIRPLLIDYVTKSSRLCKIRIKGAFFNYSFITFHAPTKDKDSVEKELFYEELHALYASCPKNDVKVLLGDANAKIGKEKEFRSIIGKFSLHDTSSDNGKRLIDFAADHNMIIPSTMHKSDIEDVRTYRGANLDSDHFLIIAKLRARISNIRKIRGKCLEKFHCKQLKDEAIKLKFQNQIDSNFEESKDNHRKEDSINDKWNSLKETIVKTGNEVVGKAKKTKRKDWFDCECYMITEKKNEAYKKMLNKRHSRNAEIKYKEARREEKRIHKIKKKAFLEDLLKNAEHLRGSNESRAFFREINLGRKEFKPRATSCRDKNGAILTNKMQVLKR